MNELTQDVAYQLIATRLKIGASITGASFRNFLFSKTIIIRFVCIQSSDF